MSDNKEFLVEWRQDGVDESAFAAFHDRDEAMGFFAGICSTVQFRCANVIDIGAARSLAHASRGSVGDTAALRALMNGPPIDGGKR